MVKKGSFVAVKEGSSVAVNEDGSFVAVNELGFVAVEEGVSWWRSWEASSLLLYLIV